MKWTNLVYPPYKIIIPTCNTVKTHIDNILAFFLDFFQMLQIMPHNLKNISMFNTLSRCLLILPWIFFDYLRSGCSYKRETPGILVVMEIFLYPHCITVNNLLPILYYTFARCYYCGKFSKVHTGSLYCFLQLQMNLQLSRKKN